MPTPYDTTADAALLRESPLSRHAGWSIFTLRELGSTNSAAACLPAWHAVRAEVQTSGRGRTGRSWISDEGGLWLSAVLPCPGAAMPWSLLPLAAGWAIIGALHQLGAPGLRLRWPNDIMVNHRKLAGLLVERYTADTIVVGIGLNVLNLPESADAALTGRTTRLADIAPAGRTLDDLTHLVLRAIRRAHEIIAAGEFPVIAAELNAHWSSPRLVSILLNDHVHPFTGLFSGIDDSGRLRVSTDYASTCFYDPAQVSLLRELE